MRFNEQVTPPPFVIGHRGACGYRPEHTLASYELAARLGADFLEPDLVMTSDGHLVARHESEIGHTTDVASRPEFATRRTTKVIDGREVSGWFSEDFTLAEIKTLRAIERIPQLRQQNTLYDGAYEVPTFTEILDLRQRMEGELGRPIGVYPETKSPSYFESLGLSFDEPLLTALRAADLDRADAWCFVQSFEITNLRRLREAHGARVPMVFLTEGQGGPHGDPRRYEDYLTGPGLTELAETVQGIGPAKDQVIARTESGALGESTGLVARAHAAGLVVHPYTFRVENAFLPTDLRVGSVEHEVGRAFDEQLAFLGEGVDGLFCDQADVGVEARRRFLDGR